MRVISGIGAVGFTAPDELRSIWDPVPIRGVWALRWETAGQWNRSRATEWELKRPLQHPLSRPVRPST
jgi:hypothetical protein